MKRTAIFALLAIALWFAIRASVIRIAPDEIGVRTCNLGPRKGIVEEDFGPGYHRNIWLLDTWNRFPSSVQHIRFGKDGLTTDGAPVGELQLTSAGGDRVLLTLQVVYRIADGLAHRVLQDSGAGRRYEEVVRNLAQDAARIHFGTLRTEGFYHPASRDRAREAASALLGEKLRLRGLHLVSVLVENIEFDANYESLIKQKTIADQQVELQKARSRAAEEKGKVDRIRAETVVKVQKIERETEAETTRLRTETDVQAGTLSGEAGKYANQKNADGSLYEGEKKAAGQRLIKIAQADGTRRINGALAGEGGRNLVALEAAKSLTLSDVSFPSFGYEWFNPHEMALRLGGTADGPSAPPAKP